MNRILATLRRASAIRPDERVIAARVGAGLWTVASASILGLALVLPAAQAHRTALLGIGAAGLAWGALCGLVLYVRRLPVGLIHASAITGVATVAVVIALSGGARSPAWACLFYVVVFAAYFMRPAAAGAYFAACVLVQIVVVVVFAAPSDRSMAAARLVVAGPAFVVLGVAILTCKRFMSSLRGDAERLAAEQGALRRVATGVVAGLSDAQFYAMVAAEAADLIGADSAAILYLSAPGEVRLVGAHARDATRRPKIGDRFPVRPSSEFAGALDAGRPLRADRASPAGVLSRLGYASSIVAPLMVGDRVWGCLVVASDREAALSDEDLHRLTEFGGLIATSITHMEDRAELAAQAATDALTGVANRRTFYERLAADLARARRYGSPVSVGMIDVDHFKQVNDAGGHETGDERLIRVARCLSDAARAEDTLARIGGDEFAWILPETTGHEALIALERVRRVIADASCQPPPPTTTRGTVPPLTVSAGVCDSSLTRDPNELVRLADRALYASKENGRDQVRLYSPDTDAHPDDDPAAPATVPPERHRRG